LAFLSMLTLAWNLTSEALPLSARSVRTEAAEKPEMVMPIYRRMLEKLERELVSGR